MKKLRLSYSLLLLWSMGRTDEAVSTYLHLETKKTDALIEGVRLHKDWASEIERTKALSLGGSIFKFKNPRCEVRHVVSYSPQFDLVGHFDCLDGETLYEFKSGITSSSEYISALQIPFYFLLGELARVTIDRGLLIHHNQHNNKTDVSLIWNSQKQKERARNYIDSLAPEIYQFFLDHRIPFDKDAKTSKKD